MQKQKTSMNMEDIMRMNEILKPYQERFGNINKGNLDEKCNTIEADVMSIEDLSNNIKEEEIDLNKGIETVTNDIFKHFDDSYNEFNPELLNKYKFLKQNIKEQKDENANLLKQIDLLNQEIAHIFDDIKKLGGRLDQLETVSGVQRDENEDYDNYSQQDEEEDSELR